MLAECLKIFGGKFRHSEKAIFFDITLQMFTGIYRDSAGKSECGDFKFMGIAYIPAIPVILKSPHSDVKIVGILTLQGYYRDTPH